MVIMDFAVRLLFFPFILAFKLIGEFSTEIIEFLIKSLAKILWNTVKALFMGMLKIITKGTTTERIIFMALLVVYWICEANVYPVVEFLALAGIIILGGTKK